jgi:hypothetical protein
MAKQRIAILFLVLVSLLAARSAASADWAPPVQTSGIQGQVTIGPTCPVERIDDPCPDLPLAATLLVQDVFGNDLLTVQSGEDGFFSVSLEPGQYTLVPLSPSPGAPPYAAPQVVSVLPGGYTFVVVSYDSVIR